MALLLILTLLLAPDDIQADFARLKAQTERMVELGAGQRSAPPEERRALQAEVGKAREECLRAYTAFCETHCNGVIGTEAAALLRRAGKDRALLPLLTTYARWALAEGAPRDFIASCAKIDPREELLLLDIPRAAALYAAGDEQQAFLLARDRIEILGHRALFMIAIQAAIHAGRGEYEEARTLYADYAADFGDEGDPRGYRYRDPARWIGRRAPQLAIDTWLAPGGEPLAAPAVPAGLGGQVVVLDFWQSWCSPCRQSMPFLSRLQSERAGRPFRVIGLCYDDATPNAAVPRSMPGFDPGTGQTLAPEKIAGAGYVPHVQAFMRGMELGYAVGVAKGPDNNQAYGVRTLPTVFVVDSEGRIAWMAIGTGLGFHLVIETLSARLLERIEKKTDKKD